MAGVSIGLPGFNLGLPAMPGFSSSAPAMSSINSAGASFGASGAGDWNVNLAGSGNALQSASSMPWLLILGAVAVGVILWKN